jgi:hypothetical protein
MIALKFSNPTAQILFDSIKTFAENVPVYNLAKDLRAAGLPVAADVPDERFVKSLVGDMLAELVKVNEAEAAELVKVNEAEAARDVESDFTESDLPDLE